MSSRAPEQGVLLGHKMRSPGEKWERTDGGPDTPGPVAGWKTRGGPRQQEFYQLTVAEKEGGFFSRMREGRRPVKAWKSSPALVAEI